jgi:DNA-binding MarR family transcriptional regulator
MTPLDRKAAELRDIVQEIVRQFQAVNEAAADGPFAHLNMQELRVVELLGEQGPRMMREVSEFLGVAVNSVTSIVDGLETKGLLRRQRSAEDRRVVRVELTDSGQETYRVCVEEHLRFNRSILGTLTEDEQEIVLVLFRKIARAGCSQVQQMSATSTDG